MCHFLGIYNVVMKQLFILKQQLYEIMQAFSPDLPFMEALISLLDTAVSFCQQHCLTPLLFLVQPLLVASTA